MKSERGFSLVELLIAITILAIGLLAVAGMQSTAISSNAWANRLSTATSLAQEVMEDLLAKDATDVIFSATSTAAYDLCPDALATPPATTCPATSITISGAGTFSATRTITINNPVTGTVKIDVSVTDQTRTVTFTGYKRVI